MKMQNIFKMSLGMTMALIATCAVSATEQIVASSDEVVPGVWNSNFVKGKKYADEHQLPMFVYYGSTSCSYCSAYRKVLVSDEFKAWVQAHPIVLIYKYGTSDELQAARASSASSSAYPDFWETRKWLKSINSSMSEYPFVGVHLASTKKNVDIAFSGRSSSIPGSGSGAIEKTVSVLEKNFGDYESEAGDIPDTPDPVVTDDFGNRNLTYRAVIGTSNSIVGVVTVTAKKANSSGRISVSVQATDMNGKKHTLRGYTTKTDRQLTGSLGKLGVASLEFSEYEVSGCVGDNLVESDHEIGGSLQGSSATFALGGVIPAQINGWNVYTNALPIAQQIAVSAKKYNPGKTGSVSWNNSKKAFVVSASNPSALKLQYNASSGLVKGSFKVFTYQYKSKSDDGTMSGVRVKSLRATVYAYEVDGVAMGYATIDKAGTFPITIEKD